MSSARSRCICARAAAILASLQYSPNANRSYEMRVVRASIDGDSAQVAALVGEPGHTEDDTWLAGYSTALFTHDYATTRKLFVHLYDDISRPAYVRARTGVVLAELDVLHGRFANAQSRLDQVAALSPAMAFEYRGAIAVLPYPVPDTNHVARLRSIRDALERWDAGATPDVPPSAANFSTTNGLHALARDYLIGMINAALGDTAGATRAAREMSTFAAAHAHILFTQNLSDAILDELTWTAGHGVQAVPPIAEYYQLLLGSVFRSQSRERYRWAQSLAAAGRDSAAISWYSSFEVASIDDMLFLAPSHLELARLHARMGQKALAAEHYRAFLALWSNCDPALRPLVTQAERERAALQ